MSTIINLVAIFFALVFLITACVYGAMSSQVLFLDTNAPIPNVTTGHYLIIAATAFGIIAAILALALFIMYCVKARNDTFSWSNASFGMVIAIFIILFITGVIFAIGATDLFSAQGTDPLLKKAYNEATLAAVLTLGGFGILMIMLISIAVYRSHHKSSTITIGESGPGVVKVE